MRTTKAARVTVIGGGVIATGVLMLAGSLQSAPTSFRETRTAIAQRFVAALPNAFASETIPVKKAVLSKDSVARRAEASASSGQEVRKLNTVKTTGVALHDPAFLNPYPAYPAVLRAAETEGAVIARFRYDANGAVDPSSISILTTTNGLLTESVQTAVRGWHGAANTVAQVPFVFVIDTKTGKDLSTYPGGLPEGSVVVKGTAISAESLAGAVAGGAAPRPVNENQTYFEFQVEKPVQAMPGNPGPRYPDSLRTAGVEGEVLAQFVVGPDGRPDMATFKVLKSSHDLFTETVMKALPNMRFTAPEVGDKKVKQLVQMPFQFNLVKEP